MSEDLWYNPNENGHEIDNEVLIDLLKKGCTGELGKEYDQLKNLLFELSIEERQKSISIARHSLFPGTEKSSPIVQFSKYHLDFQMKEGEKCKVGVVLKDKLLISNKGSSKALFNFSNIPIPSKNIKLSFTPSSGTLKKGSSQEITVEMTVLCTTKVRELIGVDISNSGRYLLTIKMDSKMSQVLDYSELEFGNIIGGGGYGVIHKAKWRGLSVAVKAISEMSDGSEFEKELEMHKELLHHPNIVHFVGFCVSPKCLVLEYIEGGSLDKYLEQPQQYQFTAQFRLKIAYDIAKGMCFLHRNEILHLDLKPQNFLVVSLSMEAPVSIKLADFGLATASSRSFYGSTVAGSFLYNSPEVFTQKKFSRAADVWSYGACLIEILTGKRPYQEYDELGYLELARVREEGFPPKIPDEIDPDMKKIIESCLLKDHSKRPSFEHIESFLSHKCQDILMSINDASSGNISGSPSSSVLSLSKDGSNGSFGSSSSSFLFSKLQQQQHATTNNIFTPPRPSTPIPHSDSTSGVRNNSSAGGGSGLVLPSLLLQRKINNQNNFNVPSPNTAPPAITTTTTTSKSSLVSPTNKTSRAMTESVTSTNQQKIELPSRSVTISSTQFEKPVIKNHRPLPIPQPISKQHPNPPQPIIIDNSKEFSRGIVPQVVPQIPIPSSPRSPDNTNYGSPNIPNSSSSSSNNSSTSLVHGTKIKPLSSSSSSTPQIQLPSPNHKPLIRAASSVDIKSNPLNNSGIGSIIKNNPITQTTTSPPPPPPTKENSLNALNLIKPSSVLLTVGSPTSLKLLEEISTSESESSASNLKFSELKLRSLKWLKDHYLTFSNVMRSFQDIKSLKECIELGQKVRNFKKDLELLCIEHIKIGWDTIHSCTKKIVQKPHLLQIPSPNPSHFDGETYNKVIQLRDAAVIVGESALDGLFYLITQLSPMYFCSKNITQSTSTFSLINEFNINLYDQKEKLQQSQPSSANVASKDIIVKIAKVTIGIKDF